MTTFRSPTQVGRLLSCREAAAILGVSVDSVRRMAAAGKIEAVRIGVKCVRVSGASVLSLTTSKANGGAK